MSERDMMIAREIMNQLGGKRFSMMTGAKNYLAIKDGLTFSLPGKSGFVRDKINRVAITLNEKDLYDITYSKMWKSKGDMQIKYIKTFKDVYCDELVNNFEETTGLYTYL